MHFIYFFAILFYTATIVVSIETTNLEDEYNAVLWIKRLTPGEVVKYFIDFGNTVGDVAKKTIPCELDVPYGPGKKEKLDIFGTDLPDDAPIFIFVHGGYWHLMNREMSDFAVRLLYKNKIKSIVIGYDLCPTVKIPDMIEEVHRAFNYSLDYAKHNGSRAVYIAGHSAGGHLVASIFGDFYDSLPEEERNLLHAVYLFSGIYDLTPLLNTTVKNDALITEEIARDYSPQSWDIRSKNKNLKFHVMVGENESNEFHRQAKAFYEKLHKAGLNSDFMLVKNKDHFNIVESLDDDKYDVLQKIVKEINN